MEHLTRATLKKRPMAITNIDHVLLFNEATATLDVESLVEHSTAFYDYPSLTAAHGRGIALTGHPKAH